MSPPPARTRINMRGGGYVVVPGTVLGTWRKLVDPDLGLPHPRTQVRTQWQAFDQGRAFVNTVMVDSLYELPSDGRGE